MCDWCGEITINNLVCYHYYYYYYYQDKYFSTDLLAARPAARQGPLKGWDIYLSPAGRGDSEGAEDTQARPG